MLRKLIFIAIVLLFAPLAHADVVATSNFPTPGPLGSDWCADLNSLEVSAANQVVATGGGVTFSLAHWCGAGTFTDDQIVQATITAINGTSEEGAGICVRCSAGGNGYFYSYIGNGFIQVYVISGGVPTFKHQTARTPHVGDIIQAQAIGTDISFYLNGVLDYDMTDSTLSTGAPGLAGSRSGGSVAVGSWIGGNLPITPTLQTATSVGHVTVGQPFSVHIVLSESHGLIAPATQDTGVSLSVTTGTGVLSGTTTDTIPMGDSSVTINGVIYSKIETGVVLTSTRTSGDMIAPGDTPPFTIFDTNVTTLRDSFPESDGPLPSRWTTYPTDGTNLGTDHIQVKNHAFASTLTAWTNTERLLNNAWAVQQGHNFRNDQYAEATVAALQGYRSTVNITDVSCGGGNATYTYTLTDGAALIVPQDVIISGLSDSGNNGYYLTTALGTGTFTVTNSGCVAASGQAGTGISPSDAPTGLMVRVSPDGMTGYYCYCGGPNSFSDDPTKPDGRVWQREIWKIVDGVFMGLGFFQQPILPPPPDSPGDVYRIAVIDNPYTGIPHISLLKNNVLYGSVDDPDGNVLAGSPGIITESMNGPYEYRWAEWGFSNITGTGYEGQQYGSWVGSDYPVTPPENYLREPLATDNFNRANTCGSGLGASWTVSLASGSGLCISGNRVYASASTNANTISFNNTTTFSNDQYAKMTLPSIGSGNYRGLGVCVRADANENAYCWEATPVANKYQLLKYVNGSPAIIQDYTGLHPASSDVIELWAIGSQLVPYVNGVQESIYLDADLVIGSPGIIGTSDVGTANQVLGDDWEGGNLDLPKGVSVTSNTKISGPTRIN